MARLCAIAWLIPIGYVSNGWVVLAWTYLQLPLWQWGASNVYLLVLSSWKVNIAENFFGVMGL